jgi:7-cyano-7-deazaguanine synthase
MWFVVMDFIEKTILPCLLEPGQPVAVLTSGGSDSAILAVDLARRGFQVYPLYIRFGLRWEEIEIAHARQFLAAAGHPNLRPLVELNQPMGDIYGTHWSRQGAVPDAQSADEAVYLPGRNIMLVSKAAVWSALNGVHFIFSGVLAGNPFSDATQTFFDSLTAAISMGLEWHIEVARPYAHLKKIDVLKIGHAMPLQFTFSCLSPVDGRHCGDCNKCAERQKAFREAGIVDQTEYAAVAASSGV